MKKILRKAMSVFLAAAIILCTMSVMVSAREAYKFIYEKMGDEETGEYYSVWITGYEGRLPSVLDIPSEMEGLPVESIEAMAFMNNTEIREVVIPETVYWVEDYAFAKCANLIKLTFPRTLGYIDVGAFFGCDRLKDIVYNGYSADYTYMFIAENNGPLWDAEWFWTHYQNGIGYSNREYSIDYRTQGYLTPDYELSEGESVIWWNRDYCDDCDYNPCLYVDYEGYADAWARGSAVLGYEIIDEDGNVVFAGEDLVTVRYNFLQWIIEYILFGWLWGF